MLSSSSSAAPGRPQSPHPHPHTSSASPFPSSNSSPPPTAHGEVARLSSDTTTPPKKRLKTGLEREIYPRKIHIQEGEEEAEPNVTSPGLLDRSTTTVNSWRESYRRPSASGVDYGTPDEHAVPVRRPSRRPTSEDEMVVPKGPTRPHTFFSKSVSTGASRPLRSPGWRFDLTSTYTASRESDVEPRRKKQKIAQRMEVSDAEDEILYSGRPIAREGKTVSSSILPYEPVIGSLGGAEEFVALEKMVAGSREGERVGEGRSRMVGGGIQRREEEMERGSPVDSSRANPITIEDDDDRDEIQDSGPEISRPYMGTANHRRPRTAEEKNDMANRRGRRQSTIRSHHFRGDEPNSFFRNAAGGSNGIDAVRKMLREKKTSSQTRQGHLDTDEIEAISDEEVKREVSKPGNVMSKFTKEAISRSISTGGDIPASYPGARQRIVNGNSIASKSKMPMFPIKYIRSSTDTWEHKDGADQWYFEHFPRDKSFHIMADGGDASKIFESFVIKPSSIQKVTYGENGKILLHKPADTTKPGSNRLLIELDGENRGGRFILSLQRNGLDCTVNAFDDARMDRIFQHTEDEFDNIRQPSKRTDGLPEDVTLLRKQRALKHEQSERGNAGPANGDLKGERLDGLRLPRSQRLSDRMQKDDSSNGPSKLSHNDDEELPKKFKNPATITRSTRSQNREPQRSPSPPPVYWTEQNPGWEAKWKGGALVFPLDGKKQTPVDSGDIKRLDEGEFLNDNLISFYLRYLEDKAERERPDVAKRVHIMSPFFYQRLTRGKGRKNIDYDGVKRWTSKVNIFAYDYIVVPVNENQHWYLAIICNAPKLIQPPKEETEEEQQAEVCEKDVIDLGDSQVEVVLPAKTPQEIMEGQKSPDIENKVENLSIEDNSNEWPPVDENGEPHAHPSTLSKDRTGIADNQASGKSPVTIEDNDLPREAAPNSAQRKNRRRKSHPPVRRYDTAEPRIITLDSLDHAHSPTCSNLKEFLICEAKEKLGVEVTLAQHSIGMTAKNIPLQDNYCDCGLYLLGYVEGFMENPDETIHDIMRANDTSRHFRKMDASNMRGRMRELIFELKKEQWRKEVGEIKARRAAKEAGKRNESSSASTSPKPGSTATNEVEIPASSATETAEVEEPSVCEVQPAEAREETAGESPQPDGDVVNIFMDDLTGYGKVEPSETDAREAKPVPLGDGPEYTARNAINETTPPPPERQTSKPSSLKTKKYFGGLKTTSRKPKFPSREATPKPAADVDEGVPIPVGIFRDAQPDSQDSLLLAMSPGKRRAAKKPRLGSEVPDSQEDGGKQEGEGFVDLLGGEVRRTVASPGLGRGSPRQRAETKSPRMRLAGASSMFGRESPRARGEERRGEDKAIVVD